MNIHRRLENKFAKKIFFFSIFIFVLVSDLYFQSSFYLFLNVRVLLIELIYIYIGTRLEMCFFYFT